MILPTDPPAYGPLHFPATVRILGTAFGLDYYAAVSQRVPPAPGPTFTVPAGTGEVAVNVRASYATAQAQFLVDCGAASVADRQAAVLWFTKNVNHLYGYAP